jgi:hypothetical protein
MYFSNDREHVRYVKAFRYPCKRDTFISIASMSLRNSPSPLPSLQYRQNTICYVAYESVTDTSARCVQIISDDVARSFVVLCAPQATKITNYQLSYFMICATVGVEFRSALLDPVLGPHSMFAVYYVRDMRCDVCVLMDMRME